jgi:hypothetical protein
VAVVVDRLLPPCDRDRVGLLLPDGQGPLVHRRRPTDETAEQSTHRPPLFALLRAPQAFADQPEHRRPETDEEGAPFGIRTFVLADRLGPDPEDDAAHDRSDRETEEVVASKTEPS